MSRRLDTKLVTKFFEDNTDKYIGLPSEVDILKDFLLFFLKEEGYVVVERG